MLRQEDSSTLVVIFQLKKVGSYCQQMSVVIAGSEQCWECLAYDVSNVEPMSERLAFNRGSSELSVKFKRRWRKGDDSVTQR